MDKSAEKKRAGRKKGYRTPDEIREKIQGAMIIGRLQDHVTGNAEMSTSQVNAAKTLLSKIIPDLKAVELSGQVALSHEKALEELDG